MRRFPIVLSTLVAAATATLLMVDYPSRSLLINRLTIGEWKHAPTFLSFIGALCCLPLVIVGIRRIQQHWRDGSAESTSIDDAPASEPADPVLWLVVEIGLFLTFSWTIAYQIIAFVRLPAYASLILTGLIFAALVVWASQYWRKIIGQPAKSYGYAAIALLLGVLAGYYTLVVSPAGSPDDVENFHRALVQIENLDQPYFLSDVIHNVEGLPFLAASFGIQAYDQLGAHLSAITGIPTLAIYHNILPFYFAIAIIATYVLLYQTFGLSKGQALGAVVLMFVFLHIDTEVSRSYGSFTFRRLWQGRALVWTYGFPILLLSTYRYFKEPNQRDLVRIALTLIAGVGFSSSGVFLMPAFIGVLSIAYFFHTSIDVTRLKRIASANAAVIYHIGFLIAIVSGVLSLADWTANDITVLVGHNDFTADTWYENLGLVMTGLRTVARNLLIVIVIPAITLKDSNRRLMVLFSLLAILVFMMPITAPIWFGVLSGHVYWRLYYLLPLPFSFGLLARVPKLRPFNGQSVGVSRAGVGCAGNHAGHS